MKGFPMNKSNSRADEAVQVPYPKDGVSLLRAESRSREWANGRRALSRSEPPRAEPPPPSKSARPPAGVAPTALGEETPEGLAASEGMAASGEER